MENKKRTFRRIAAASAAICLSLNIAFAEELGTNKLGFGSSISVSAADSTISIGTATVIYTADAASSSVTITKVIPGSETRIEIPETIHRAKVTAIGYEAFMDCTALKSVTIPDSVDSIEKSAFESCTALEEVNFGRNSSLSVIGEEAFMGCSALKSMILPDSVDTIRIYAFDDCTSLTSVKLPENDALIIGAGAFSGCESLKSIDIPESVMTIEKALFRNCTSLEEVNFSSSSDLISIGEEAFRGCTALKSMILPDSVDTIGIYAFDNCTNLASVKLPVNDSLTIRAGAFSGCESLESIAIPNGVTDIGSSAFENCDKLKNVFCKAGLDLNNSGIPDTSAKTRYEISDNFMYITEVIPDSGNTPVVIPDTVCGYEVKSVAEGYRKYVSETGHTHRGGTATCTEAAECLICGTEYGSTDPNNHDTDTSVWEYNEQEHWNTCRRTGCGAHLNTAAHSYDNGVITTKPTETSEGIKTYTCTVCGYEKTEAVPKSGHTPAAEWEYDAESHWKPCTECGEKLETAAHSYDDGVITAEPTETSEGIKTYTCTVCGYEKTESIEKLPSKPAAVIYPIWVSGDVTVGKPSAAVGETVTVSAPFGYDIIIADANGKTIAKISEKGSFEMPASGVRITAVRGEIFAHMSNAWSHSYVYSYDSDMDRIKVNSDTKRGIVTIDLGADYAGRSFTLYSGRKSTSKKLLSGTLDENGRYIFNAAEGRNYTLVIE